MSTPDGRQVAVRGVTAPLAPLITEAAMRALPVLGDVPVEWVIICVDDLPGAEEIPWYGDRDPDFPAQSSLVIYCGLEAFLKRGSGVRTLSGPLEMWEQVLPGRDGEADPGSRFHYEGTERFLHHHLLFAADLLAHRMDPALIPGSMQSACQAAWAVTVDGRLARRGLPGYSLQERRGIFSRLFAGAGILLPDHWHIFRGLWDGDLVTQEEIQAVVGRLPRL